MAAVADPDTFEIVHGVRRHLARARVSVAVGMFGCALAAALTTISIAGSRQILPVTLGLAVVLALTAARTPLRASARWFGVLLVGSAAALRLVNAGPGLHYQHFVPWREFIAADPLSTMTLAAQAALVVAGFAGRWRAVVAWWRDALGPYRGALLGGAFVLSSATLSASPREYVQELAVASIVQLVALGTIVLAAWELPKRVDGRLAGRLSRWLDGDTEERRAHVETFAVVCAAAVTVVTALLCVFVYERHPHVQDEVKYLYQARYFAAGHLAMAPPPVPRAFELYLMEVGSRGWYSVVPPGWPLILAVGQWFGAAWLVNPVLSGVNVMLAFLLFWKLYDRATAKLATLLLCMSPWNLYLGMSFMPHTVTLTCGLLGALGVLRARETGAVWPAWAAGASVGWLSLVRQLDGLVVAVLLGLWAIGLGGRRLRLAGIAGLVAGTALIGALVLPYNRYFTGSATAFPIMVHNDRLFGVNSNAYGFGKDRGMGWPLDPFPGHGPIDATINAALNTTTMNTELFGWASGSLLLAYFLVLSGRARSNDRLFVALAAGVFVAYFFNYFSGGPDFGARYWFLMLPAGVVLTVRGTLALADSLGNTARPLARARIGVAVVAMSAAALLVFVPWRATDKYYRYLAMSPEPSQLARQHGFGRSLVLVRGEEFPDYASAAIYNPLDVRADAPVYAHDRDDATRAELLRAYADRPVWILDGPSRTHAGYRIVAGPLAREAAQEWGADR